MMCTDEELFKIHTQFWGYHWEYHLFAKLCEFVHWLIYFRKNGENRKPEENFRFFLFLNLHQAQLVVLVKVMRARTCAHPCYA